MLKSTDFSKCSVYAVECRIGGQWQRVPNGYYASKGMAQLRARLTAQECPLHAVRIRENIIFTSEPLTA